MSKKRFSSMSNLDVVKAYLDNRRPYLTISTHVTEKEKHRKNGEQWTVDGKEYKKEDGKTICLTKTQGDIIRDTIGDAFNCKWCGQNYKWASQKDQKFLRRCGLCMDCVIDYETKLRILGIYEAYEKYKLASNELGATKDLKVKIEDTLKYFSSGDTDVTMLCNSEGFIERWKTTNAEEVITNAKKDLEETSERIDTLIKFRDECKQKYIKDATKYGMEILC